MVAIAAGVSVACKIALAIAAACAAAGAAEAGAQLLEDYNKSSTATEKDKEATGSWLSEYKENGNTENLWKTETEKTTTDTATSKGNAEKQEQIDSIQGNNDTGTYQQHYDSTLKANERLTAKAGDFEFTEDQTVGEMLPGGEGTQNYDEKSGLGVPGTEGTETEVKDETDTNTGTNTIDWIKWAEEDRNLRWEREDAIRAETQAREDSAYQRAVADMRKAGINPNLMNVQPASSGGGITQASGQNL